MNNRETDNLMTKVRQGDNAAFDELYTKTVRGVMAFVFTYCKSLPDCEDVAQETFIKVKLRASSYTPGTNAAAWILEIAKNTALDKLRRSRREIAVEVIPEKHESYSAIGSPAIEAVLNRLSPDEARIVMLHVVGGFKHREIAKMMNKPLGSVTWSYNNSIKKLKNYLKEDDNEE